MARIERGPSFGRSRVQEQPEEGDNVATQTEQAFGLAGEDTAMSIDEYNRQQEEKRAQNEQTMLQEYLADDDAFYTEEYLRSLPANRMVDILYEEDRDLVSKYTDPQKAAENEFTLKEVPTAIAPYVRVVAKGAGFVTVKPLEGVEPIMEEGVAAQLAAAKKQEVTEEVSTGEATARKLTLRETHEAKIAKLFEATGIAGDSFRARQMAKDIVGDPNADNILESFGAADVFGVPAAIYGLDEAYREGEANYQTGGGSAGYVAPVFFGALSAAEAVPLGGLLFKGGKRLARGQSFRRAPDSPKTIDEINAEVDTRHAEYLDARGMTYEDYVNKADKKYNLDRVKQATAEVKKAQRKATDDVLKENQSLADDIMEDFIDAYEERNLGVDIHKVVNGRKIIDFEKARGVGISRMQDLDLPDDQISAEGFGKDGYRNPQLNPDMVDPLIAVVIELAQEYPDMFAHLKKSKRKRAVKTKDGKTIIGTVKGEKEPKGLNTIEMLFEASVKGDIGDEKLEGLLNSPRLYELLEKHGLGLDGYVQTVMGAASVHGRGLKKFQQLAEAMKARKTPEQLAEEEMNEALKGMGPKMKGLKRFENVVRGAMVGTIATAMRNFEGFIIRAPMEGLTNLFTNALVAGAKGGMRGEEGLLNYMKENPFKNSFRTYGEMFRDRKGIAEYTDLILDREEFAPLMTRFYDQVNEIQKGLGRGEATSKAGKVADYTLSGMEDFVHFINAPNRMQEFLARRTAFMDKLGQMTQREYGLNLVDTINAGRIGDLMNDAESLIGQNKRSFKELVADAGESALDITYANAPKTPFLRDVLKLFNKIPGGTFAIPFPRFMFKSMEYMYETTAGLPHVATKKILGIGDKGKLVGARGEATYNAEMAARGMAGWTAIGTTYLAAEAGFVTDDNKLRLPNGKAIDVTPQFPLAQLVYLGKAMQKLKSSEKDFHEWFDGRDFVGLFSGTNFRTNTGMGEFIDDMFQILGNEAKIGKAEATSESLGKFVANVGTSLLQPYQMVIDTERALGIRDTTMRSYSSDPDMTMGGSFVQGFTERFRARGFTGEEYTDAEDIDVEAGDAPVKQYATKPGGKDRGRLGSLVKMTLGLNIMDDMTEEQEFFKRYGYNDWDLSSRTGVGTVDNAINETLSGILPTLAQSLMDVEESMIERGDSDVIVKKELASRIKDQVNGIKQEIRNRGLRTAGANNPAFVEELFKLRTFNAEAQRIIVERFREANDGESPDLTDVGDLRALNEIGFRGRYGRSLFD